MHRKPWLSSSTTVIPMRSWTAVTSSVDSISQEPSPTITNTRRSGSAIAMPTPPATS
jgi:hypothetical protein